MAYEYRKIDAAGITEAGLEALKREGWEPGGELLDKQGSTRGILRFRRPVRETSDDDVVLSPDDVYAKIRAIFGTAGNGPES